MAGSTLSQKVREEVRQKNDIVEVIGSYLPLKRAGANFRALCPFHKEKTPSFHVNPQRQIFHCFGCGAGGDVFSFLMQAESLTFPEAAERLAQRVGLEWRPGPAAKKVSRDRQTILRANLAAADYFAETLCSPRGAGACRPRP